MPFVLVDRAKFSASTERSCWGQVLSRGVAFSRVQIAYGEPVRVPRVLNADGIARLQLEMADKLQALDADAHAALRSGRPR